MTLKLEIYWLPGPCPGCLGIRLRPWGGDWLSDEIRAWRKTGLDMVASLLTTAEEAELNLQDEETISQKRGIRDLGESFLL